MVRTGPVLKMAVVAFIAVLARVSFSHGSLLVLGVATAFALFVATTPVVFRSFEDSTSWRSMVTDVRGHTTRVHGLSSASLSTSRFGATAPSPSPSSTPPVSLGIGDGGG